MRSSNNIIKHHLFSRFYTMILDILYVMGAMPIIIEYAYNMDYPCIVYSFIHSGDIAAVVSYPAH